MLPDKCKEELAHETAPLQEVQLPVCMRSERAQFFQGGGLGVSLVAKSEEGPKVLAVGTGLRLGLQSALQLRRISRVKALFQYG